MKLFAPDIKSNVALEVPTSKSIANRLLIIQALSQAGEIIGLSEAKDTQILKSALKTKNSIIDVGHAGTSFRFLTAFLSIQEGTFILTGSYRMKQRPIGILVNALRELGADIMYLERDGFPPLQISGSPLSSKEITVNANISSQFITALMLIGPYLPSGLEIELRGEMVSLPYLQMTANLMQKCGIEAIIQENHISIPSGKYAFNSMEVEKDWSAIAFWYEWVAINQTEHLLVKDVKSESIQGDRAVAGLFEKLGVQSQFDAEGLHLSYHPVQKQKDFLEFDLNNTPDLAQPLIVTLAFLKQRAKVKGISTLKNKETDRGWALKQELLKFGIEIEVHDDLITVPGNQSLQKPTKPIHTYQDHRMAMAFAPLVGKFNQLEIENPDVVEKSYPFYWDAIVQLGVGLR